MLKNMGKNIVHCGALGTVDFFEAIDVLSFYDFSCKLKFSFLIVDSCDNSGTSSEGFFEFCWLL